jgi:hypothetical protein
LRPHKRCPEFHRFDLGNVIGNAQFGAIEQRACRRRRCPPRGPRRRCASCPSAIASSRASPVGSAFAIDYNPAERTHGRSIWDLGSLVGLSVEGLTSFSVAPLRIACLLGILLAAGALVFSVWILVEAFVYGQTVPGCPSLIVGIMVIGGVQLLMIGVMGEYIGKVLSELKRRPVYFVAEHSVKRAGRG